MAIYGCIQFNSIQFYCKNWHDRTQPMDISICISIRHVTNLINQQNIPLKYGE